MAEIDGSTLPPEVNPSIIHNDDTLADIRQRGDDVAVRARDQRVEEIENQERAERIEREEEIVFQNRDGDRAEITRRGLEASSVDVNNPL